MVLVRARVSARGFLDASPRGGSHVLGHAFPPPLNPAVEIATRTLRADDIEYRDLPHKTIAAIGVIKPIHKFMKQNQNLAVSAPGQDG